jgi:hypothetical protein
MNNELPNSAMSMLRLMPSKASEVAIFAKQIIENVQNGNANPLEVKVMMRALRAVAEEVEEEIDDNAISEAEKYSEKVVEMYGARIEKAEVGVNYNYASSGLSEWEKLDAEIKALTDRRKEKETFLRALKEPMTVVNESTGEIETIKPPLKKSKSGIKVYLASK